MTRTLLLIVLFYTSSVWAESPEPMVPADYYDFVFATEPRCGVSQGCPQVARGR